MLSAFFDESYTHAPTPLVYTVGGYISDSHQWKKFRQEWTNILDEAGINFFHMSKYEARKGEYADWPNQKRITILSRLHALIKKHVFRGFATSVVINDYNKVMAEKYQDGFGNPHIFAVVNNLKKIAEWANEYHYHEPIEYIHENGSPHDAELRLLFRNALDDDEKRTHYRIGTFKLADKRDSPSLQAADILAYEMTKEVSRRLTPNQDRPVRKSIISLSMSKHDEWYFYDEKEFLWLLSKTRELGLIED